MKEELKDRCPNCEDPNPAISLMPDGSCGVCAGTGVITWKAAGKLVPQASLTSDSEE